MSKAIQEVTEKLDVARDGLDIVVRKRREAEREVSEAETVVERLKSLALKLASDEGTLRGKIGDLERMLGAFDD